MKQISLKRTLLPALLFMGTLASPSVMAQNCGVPPGQELSQAQITALLSERYVYGTQYDGQYFNLLHSGGKITDYKRGPNDPMDKSASVGTYSVGQVGGRDVVTYNYGSNSYSYSISPKPQGNDPLIPGPYVFCQRAGGSNVGQAINVTVTTVGAVRP